MDKLEPEEGAEPKDSGRLGARNKIFTARGKIIKVLMQLYCSCSDGESDSCTVAVWMVNQTAAQMRIPSDQWSSFRFF